MKKPLILVTTSNLMVEGMRVVRLNHEYVNAVVKAGGVPVIAGSPFGLDELIALADGLLLTGGVDVDPARFGKAVLNDSVHIDKARDELELQLIEKYWKTGKPALVRFFNGTPEVITYGTLFLRMMSPFYVLTCVNQILAGSLRGAGDSKTPMFIMLGSFVLFRQIYLFVVTHFISNAIVPVAISYPAGWLVCSIATVIYYKFVH